MKNGQLNSQCNKDFNMNIIDAHTHIDYMTHKIQSCVDSVVCCATDESMWDDLIEINTKDKNVYCAFGIHPWYIDSVKEGFDKRLEDALKTNRSFLVGEIGLDNNKPDMERQIDIFIKQFDIAIKLQRNVFIHCVGAWEKILHILKQYNKSDLPYIIFHAFNGNESIIKQLTKNYGDKVLFSFNKIDIYTEIRRIEQIDIKQILVESDGKKDSDLHNLINKISNIKNEENISDIIYNNTKRVLQNG